MISALSFRPADVIESSKIAALANTAYRGETSRQGWTTEADLLDGLRTTAQEVQQLIESDASVILLCKMDGEIVGSVCVEKSVDAVHVGMFVVNPALQGAGIGKQLLTYAESYAKQRWNADRFLMHVITLRHELIAFYERRGYRRTGIFKTFPVNPEMWQPKLSGLQLEVLQKLIYIPPA